MIFTYIYIYDFYFYTCFYKSGVVKKKQKNKKNKMIQFVNKNITQTDI